MEPINHGKKWTEEEDQKLREEIGTAAAKLAVKHGRSEGSIKSRISKLLLDPLPHLVMEEEFKPKKFWMVIKLAGVGSERASVRHLTELDARNEAVRLARLSGECFIILEAVSYCITRPADVDWKKI